MPTPITATGKAKLQAERDELEATLPVIREAIAEAREKGDLKENAEYHAAREDLAMAQAKIGEINAKLSDAVIVDESQIDHSAIAFGATVELKDLSDGTNDDWQLVSPGEDDPSIKSRPAHHLARLYWVTSSATRSLKRQLASWNSKCSIFPTTLTILITILNNQNTKKRREVSKLAAFFHFHRARAVIVVTGRW